MVNSNHRKYLQKQVRELNELLEKVLLEADMLDLKANPNKNAIGTVLEASLR